MKQLKNSLIYLFSALSLLTPIFPGIELLGEEQTKINSKQNNISNKQIVLQKLDKISELADKEFEKSLFQKSEEHILNAIKISKQNFGEKDIVTLNLIDKLAKVYAWQGRYKEAEYLFLNNIKIKKQIFGTQNFDYIASNRELGRIYDTLGRFKDAEKLYLKNIEIIDIIYGSNHAFSISQKVLLGNLYSKFYSHEKAIKVLSNACQIAKNYRKEYSFADGSFYSICLDRLSKAYMKKGNYTKAESILKESLEIDKNIYGQEEIEVGNKFYTLSQLYLSQNNFSKAENSILKSIKLTERLYGNENILLARRLDFLAAIYEWQNFNLKAEPLLLRSLKIAEKVYNKNHPSYAFYLGRLGVHYSDFNYSKDEVIYKKAENYLKRSYKIYKKKYGKEHPNSIKQLQRLGYFYLQKGLNNEIEEEKDYSLKLYAKAENLLKKVSKIAKTNLNLDHQINNTNLYMLGDLYLVKGDLKKAEEILKKSLKKIKEFEGPQSINTALAQIKLAEVYVMQDLFEKAKPLFKKQLIITLNYLKREAPFLPLGERSKFINSFHSNFHSLNSFYGTNEKGKDLILFMRLNRQGLLAEIEKNQSRIANLSDKNKEIVEDLISITNQISSQKKQSKDFNKLLKKKENLEKLLYRVLPKIQPRIFEVDEISRMIPKNGVLIEFQKFRPYDKTKSLAKAFERLHYFASIINSKGEIQNIDLGPSKTIDKLIEDGLVASEKSLSDSQDIFDKISSLLIQPLKSAISDSKIIIISPHLELNRIPFSALRSPISKNFLNEDYELRLVTTGRELIEIEIENSSKNRPLIIANPNFNLRNYKKNQNNIFNTSQKRSKEIKSKDWGMLPGTEKEGASIAKITNGIFAKGDKATSLIIQKTSRPKILHIASHSYYFGDLYRDKTKKISSNLIDKKEYFTNSMNKENPLLRSGIVLAGANNPLEFNNDDGYLTALEITKLDWRGTDLVVISGCESGLGEIRSGEGVYGLKRAIAIAGAKSSLLSLWKVNDSATAEFMEDFYIRLKNGESKTEALAKTQKEFRTHPIKAWRHPNVWAAFQLSGDWRPIDF